MNEPTLLLSCPDYAVTALRWICNDFVRHQLSVTFDIRPAAVRDTFKITLADKSITINNVFFRDNPFLKDKAPVLPSQHFETFSQSISTEWTNVSLPILFGNNQFIENTDNAYLGLDVLGGAFFLVSRYEEYFLGNKDLHDRFPARDSIAHRHGFLNRPLADEYIQLLCALIHRVWPMIKRKKLSAQTHVSCDVDSPYEAYLKNWKELGRKCSSDLLKRKSMSDAGKTIQNYWRSRNGDYSMDPNNTFDWIMDVNEKAGNKVSFYFLVDRTVPEFDAHYSIEEPHIRALIRHIHNRGHEIGLHASYGTYKNPAQMKKEADKLRQVMDEEGIKQDEIGSRQHYLRWSTPETARSLEASDIAYDSSLGFADHAGFRCGTCHEYPMFDVELQQVLTLRQRPLVLMETSVLSPRYMNLGYSDDTLNYMKHLKTICHKQGGTFTLLWHNSHLRTERDRQFYEQIIA